MKRRVRRRVRYLLPWVFVVALLGNIGITMKFQSGTSHSIRLSATNDLTDLLDTTYPLARETYSFYADLARVAFGANLIVPFGDDVDAGLAEAFARVSVEIADFDPEVDASGWGDPIRTGRWLASEERVVRYSMFEGEPGDPFWLGRWNDRVVVVPVSLHPVPGGFE